MNQQNRHFTQIKRYIETFSEKRGCFLLNRRHLLFSRLMLSPDYVIVYDMYDMIQIFTSPEPRTD